MDKFSKDYLELIHGPLSGLNLTRIKDGQEFYLKQVLDSVKPVENSQAFQKALAQNPILVDVGFGGGFPILPLAIRYPDVKFIGIEARKKKVEAVNFIKTQLNISNAHLFHLRLEELFFDQDSIVLFKAVGKVADYLKLIKGTTENLLVFFYKGPNFYELEGADLEKIKGQWQQIEDLRVDIPGTEGRLFVGFKKINVPRGTKSFHEQPLDFNGKLSSNEKNIINRKKNKMGNARVLLSDIVKPLKNK